MDQYEERRIIAQVCAGDANAFEALVVAYQKQVYNLALRTVGNEEDAADMTQEVFLRAYRALGTFRGESKFSVWLYRLTTNVCIDFLRSRRRHPTDSMVGSLRNADGARYTRCASCGMEGGTVYITNYGNRYHSSLTCGGLKRMVYLIRLSEAQGYHACQKCAGS